MAGPQYTSCVEEGDYKGPSVPYLAALGAVLLFGGVATLFAGAAVSPIVAAVLLEAIRYILDYLVNGKLICLHRNAALTDCVCGGPGSPTVCAIGEITDTEQVGEDKNPVEDLDDDYAINLALIPFSMPAFAAKGFVDGGKEWRGLKRTYSDAFRAYLGSLMSIATDPAHPQADLVTRNQSVHGEAAEFGYLRTMVIHDNGDYFPWNEIVGRDDGAFVGSPDTNDPWGDYVFQNAIFHPKKFSVPVLHCEFEGSRPADMLDALEGFPFGTSFCKKNFFTKLICKIVAAVLAPVVLALLAAAWLGNTKGSTAPALEGGGTIGPKSRVIVKGRWSYDTGHQGWNEIHAVRTVQQVENVPNDPALFKAFLHAWCDRLAEVPSSSPSRKTPKPPRDPDDADSADGTRRGQQKPENQWVYHPAIDGCRPDDDVPPPPPPPPSVPPPIH